MRNFLKSEKSYEKTRSVVDQSLQQQRFPIYQAQMFVRRIQDEVLSVFKAELFNSFIF